VLVVGVDDGVGDGWMVLVVVVLYGTYKIKRYTAF